MLELTPFVSNCRNGRLSCGEEVGSFTRSCVQDALHQLLTWWNQAVSRGLMIGVGDGDRDFQALFAAPIILISRFSSKQCNE